MSEVAETYLDASGFPLHKGQHVFEINHVTKEVRRATYAEFEFEGKRKLMLVVRNGCDYEKAINVKNAIRKYNQKH